MSVCKRVQGTPRRGVPCTGDSFKPQRASFCRDMFCPMCSWRRSYKIFGQVSQIINLIANKYKFLFLTLTVSNCTADELISTLNRIARDWTKIFPASCTEILRYTLAYLKNLCNVTKNMTLFFQHNLCVVLLLCQTVIYYSLSHQNKIEAVKLVIAIQIACLPIDCIAVRSEKQ